MNYSTRALAIAAGCIVSLAAALPAAAQNADACPAGQVFSVVRMSTIKPTGSMNGFFDAVHDHLKWYRDHGYTTNDIASHPVLETNDQGQTWTVSKTQVFSIHKNDPHVPRDKYDAGWSAYVAKYRANSDITNEAFVCLPK
jgi:hypothetical protein